MSSMINYQDRATCPSLATALPAYSLNLPKKKAWVYATQCSM